MAYKNLEKRRVAQKLYRQNSPKRRVTEKLYRQKNLEKERARKRKRNGTVNPSGDLPSGNCPICREFCEALQFDHDHDTRLFRGWICGPCNRGLGALRDGRDPLIFIRCLIYLGVVMPSALDQLIAQIAQGKPAQTETPPLAPTASVVNPPEALKTLAGPTALEVAGQGAYPIAPPGPVHVAPERPASAPPAAVKRGRPRKADVSAAALQLQPVAPKSAPEAEDRELAPEVPVFTAESVLDFIDFLSSRGFRVRIEK